jgi:uncharacterized RDD family membrane protein YckC
MEYDPVSFVRFGALGQIGAVALAALCWAFGIGSGFYIACGGYLLVTAFGIGGMSKAESLPTVGPLIFPFIIPGFLALYYFGTQY